MFAAGQDIAGLRFPLLGEFALMLDGAGRKAKSQHDSNECAHDLSPFSLVDEMCDGSLSPVLAERHLFDVYEMSRLL